MSNRKVAQHYTHGNLLSSIEKALHQLGKKPTEATLDDLALVDEFHIGGRTATEHLIASVSFSKKDHVLDIGCGLGGVARWVAHTSGCRVTGIDLTSEYVATGNALSTWVGLAHRVRLQQADASALPFSDKYFSGALMIHAGMNVENKLTLFREVHRVLRKRGCWALYDIMRLKPGRLRYPVPWATTEETSFLATPEQYQTELSEAGFETVSVNHRQTFALRFFEELKRRTALEHNPPLGLHTLMKESTATKLNNMINGLQLGLIAPVEIVTRKT